MNLKKLGTITTSALYPLDGEEVQISGSKKRYLSQIIFRKMSFCRRQRKMPVYKVPGKGDGNKSVFVIGSIDELRKLAANMQNFSI